MRRFTFIAALLPLIALTACMSEIHSDTTSENISISAFGAEVKGLIGSADLQTNGTKIHIVDELSGFNGKVNGSAWNDGELYIDDDVVYSGNTVWDFASGTLYPWTTSGQHTFRAWLSYDAKANDLAGLAATDLFGANGLSYSNGTLSVAGTELHTGSPQFDLLYSDTQPRNMDASPRPTGLVTMNMSHLFSALSIVINNSSVDRVKVTSVTTTGLQNKKSASVSFSGTPTYTTLTPTGGFARNAYSGSGNWLATGAKYDLLADALNPASMNYYIIWPQTAEEMAASRIAIEYQIEGDYEEGSDSILKTHRASLVFPDDQEMEAGKKYQFILTFANKRVKLLMKVLPWDYNEFTWNYEDSTLSLCTDLTLDGTPGEDYLRDGNQVTFIGGKPINAHFGIKTPIGGQWSIELRGDTSDNQITVTPNSGTVNPDVNNGRIDLVITPNTSIERTKDISVTLKFWVTFLNGYTKDLNSEVNRDDLVFTLPE